MSVTIKHIFTKVFFSLVGIFTCVLSFAQDIVFSQFQDNYITTNPAIIAQENDIRVDFNARTYRVASGDVVNTYIFSTIYPFANNASTGISVIQDNNANLIETSGILGHLGYDLKLNDFHNLSFALQGGYFQKRLNTENLIFDSQFIDDIFRSDATSNENFDDPSTPQYALISTGLFWYYQKPEDLFERHFLGVSYNNFNEPDISLLEGGSSVIPANITVHGGGTVFQNAYQDFGVIPSFRWVLRNQNHMVSLGASAYYLVNPTLKRHKMWLELGAWYHNTGLMTTQMTYHQGNYQLGLSYDLPLSNAANSIHQGGVLELSFKVNIQKKTLQRNTFKPPLPEQNTDVIYNRISHYNQRKSKKLNALKSTLITIPELKPKLVVKEERMEVLEQAFYFTEGEPDLNDESLRVLEGIVKLLKKHQLLKIELDLYIYDDSLERDYSTAIWKYLKENGIKSERIIPNTRNIALQHREIVVKLIIFE